MLEQLREHTEGIARGLNTIGRSTSSTRSPRRVFVIEANPRASRTVPVHLQGGRRPAGEDGLPDHARREDRRPRPARDPWTRELDHVSVKEAVLPFDRFTNVDAILGPEMRSTGEVMGIARDFPTAFAKAQAAAGASLPVHGTVFVTVTDSDKAAVHAIAGPLHDLGFEIVATGGTAQAIRAMGVPCATLSKIGEGHPNVVDAIERGAVDLVVNTPTGSGARSDGWEIRRAATAHGIPCITTISGGVAAARAITRARQAGAAEVLSLQELHSVGVVR
jgi:carbamoyl-phosphate synthase large subunit